MLHKLLKVHRLARPSRPAPPKPAAAAASCAPDEEVSSALKIVHAGGDVECYFMPIPAVRIIEKYPSFYVTRPDVFRRPWEAVVGPDETLALGEKYYLVPRHTVRKLRRRTRRPRRDDVRSADFGASRSFHGGAGARRKDGDSSSSFARRGDDASDRSDVSAEFFKDSRRKSPTAKKHVSFLGIDEKPRKGPPPPPAAAERKHGKVAEKASKGHQKKSQSSGEKREVKVTPTWQPALASISEIYGSDD